VTDTSVLASPFVPLPRLRGRVTYRRRGDGALWGFEDWSITRGADGLRVMAAHCEMALGKDDVVRDSILSVHPDFHPHDASVRIFSDDQASCESWTLEAGRITQTMAITRPLRGFVIHAVQGDGWLSATFPYDKGPGHRQFFGYNLLHSIHHLGATGPMIATTRSGLEYVAREQVSVAAGEFDCHRIRFVGLTNDHPPYDMWVSADGDFLYVKGEVGGYMDSVFELSELTREHGI
jgi:hypothetical protein